MQSHRELFKIFISISKTEEGEGPYPNSTEVIGKSCVYFDEVGSSLKNLVSSYYMTNVAQEKGKVQID